MFRTKYKYDHTQQRLEQVKGFSLTVPDMNYTTRELIENFTTASLPPVYQTPTFEENIDIDREDNLLVQDVDLTDIQAEASIVEQMQVRKKQEMEEKSKLKAEAKRLKMEKFEAWEKQQKQDLTKTDPIKEQPEKTD